MTEPVDEVLLKDFRPKSLLRVAEHIPETARFPVVDAHNHLFGDLSAEKLIEVMDAVGIKVWVNVTGNVTLPLENNTYTIARRDFDQFAENYMEKYPGRFAGPSSSLGSDLVFGFNGVE